MAKCITVKQPWASLIVHGIKDIENRTWKTNFRGRVLIHAGVSKSLDNIPLDGVFSEQQLWNLKSWFREIDLCEREYPHGLIIGSVEIVDCVINHPSFWAEHWAHKKWFNEQTKSYVGFERQVYNWVLANPILFDKLIPAKGKLSFWESGVEVCHICGQPADLICSKCGEYFCSKHSVMYNQFTQIDYDCCKNCEPEKDQK